MKVEESRTPSNRSRSSSTSGAYCAFTSTSGIVGTAAQSRCPAMTDQGPHDDEDDRRDDQILGVAELVVELLPVRAERPADRRQPKAPHRRARDREGRVAWKRHLHDTRRDRDERPDHGGDAADQDGQVAETLEPVLRPAEVLRGQVEQATAALQERPPPIEPD